MRSQTFKSNIKLFMHSPTSDMVHYNATQTKCSFKGKSILQFYWERQRVREIPMLICFNSVWCAFCLHCFYGIWKWKKNSNESLESANHKRTQKCLISIHWHSYMNDAVKIHIKNEVYWTELNWIGSEACDFSIQLLLPFICFNFSIFVCMCVGV